jgi:TRAP-type C4-dicarboxylate transport system permease small subunit
MPQRTLQTIRRWDAGVARIEGYVVTLLLLAMIGVAAGQALWFNLAERGVDWAARILEASTWADPFLQKGTLWLAFLGASLATHEDKHFAIDLVTKVVPARTARAMLRTASFGAGLVSLALAGVFFHACVASDATVPFEYERLTADGRQHVCDVARATEDAAGRPEVFCGLRAALAFARIPVSTGAGAAQLIVPSVLVVIGLRLLARSAGLLASRRELSGAHGSGAGDAPSMRVRR